MALLNFDRHFRRNFVISVVFRNFSISTWMPWKILLRSNALNQICIVSFAIRKNMIVKARSDTVFTGTSPHYFTVQHSSSNLASVQHACDSAATSLQKKRTRAEKRTVMSSSVFHHFPGSQIVFRAELKKVIVEKKLCRVFLVDRGEEVLCAYSHLFDIQKQVIELHLFSPSERVTFVTYF